MVVTYFVKFVYTMAKKIWKETVIIHLLLITKEVLVESSNGSIISNSNIEKLLGVRIDYQLPNKHLPIQSQQLQH